MTLFIAAAEASRVKRRLRCARVRRFTTCVWCGGKLMTDVTVEHLTPVSQGGTSDPSNLVAAHARCNATRGTALWVPRYYP